MTAGGVRLSIVIPAFNEAPRIRQTLDELVAFVPRVVPKYEIRVVDDGSEDETRSIVEDVARANERVVLQSEPHRGKGAAVRAGLLAAPGELRFMCDADLSMPVTEIPRFLGVVPEQGDIAIGSREGIGAKRVGEPFHRHLLGRVFNGVVKSSVLPGVEDSQCGFKLFTAAAARTIFPKVSLDGWAFDIEALLIARVSGLRIVEIPIEWHYREHSKVSTIRDPLRMLRDVYRIKANAVRGQYRGARDSGLGARD